MFVLYIYNNNIIDNKNNLELFFKKNFGVNFFFINSLESRLEKNFKNTFFCDFNKNDFNFFINLIYAIIPQNFDIPSRKLYNIWLLDTINTYKGWRHSIGLPTKGQRTWSNANSSFNSNKVLRDFKLNLAKKYYGQIPLKQINMGLVSEQINWLWKNQWGLEWQLSKNSILKQNSKFNSIKIDLFSMYNFQIMHPNKLKLLSKKQKQNFKKNYFSLGFEIGFSRNLLRTHNKLESNEQSNFNNVSLVLRNEKLKKNNIKKKQIIIKKPLKKKKSVWDF